MQLYMRVAAAPAGAGREKWPARLLIAGNLLYTVAAAAVLTCSRGAGFSKIREGRAWPSRSRRFRLSLCIARSSFCRRACSVLGSRAGGALSI